jgi:hypothetical protein
VSREVDNTLSMSFEDLCNYEQSIGFNSFGKLADMAYNQVAERQDEYKSVEEIKKAIDEHSCYLQLIEEDKEEYSVETKLYRSVYRYILSTEQMYQVKDTLVKELENFVISTSEKNYKELLKQAGFTNIEIPSRGQVFDI